MNRIRYFGPLELAKPDELLIATPVGQQCILCLENVQDGDTGTINLAGQLTHYECSMRGIIGSSAHQLKQCTCHGGKWEDLPGLTRRQAAIQAVHTWNRLRKEYR